MPRHGEAAGHVGAGIAAVQRVCAGGRGAGDPAGAGDHIAVHQHGWAIVMGPDRHPWIRPPATVDPSRELQPAHNRRTLRLDTIAA